MKVAMKRFNTTGLCVPSKHYMVDITDRLIEIKKMIDAGKYFVMNRGRQYGKTTTLNALCGFLAGDYIVLSLDFQDIGVGLLSMRANFPRRFQGLCWMQRILRDWNCQSPSK